MEDIGGIIALIKSLGKGGGGTGGEVTKAYVNAQDAKTLREAKSYADGLAGNIFPEGGASGDFLVSDGAGGVIWKALINRAEVGG